ncbi:MAG: IS1634 family transposase, partial [Actinomycetia bacterium]|nr:IS1634 family transposase [Actinomycetes bacterium]
QLDRIIAALQSHADDTWLHPGDLEADGAPGFGAVATVWSLFRRLGLDDLFANLLGHRTGDALADTVFVMIANRLVAPASKRRTVFEWLDGDVELPNGVAAPSLDQCYRALDAVADHVADIEAHLFARLTSLLNLELRWCCYDLTSTYFESVDVDPDGRFPSKRFGYSRDKRSDRPQVMIGLLVTGDGIPIAHGVFDGNTADSATMPDVLADLQDRFGVGRIALVADRGLISADNLNLVTQAGFDHVIATKLRRDPAVAAVLEAAAAKPDTDWVPVTGERTACEISHDDRRHVIIDSPARRRRDDHRREELLENTETQLIALADRVHSGRLVDPIKISAAAQRIPSASAVSRCFTTNITQGTFTWNYDDTALDYEQRLLAGRYVLTTSLTPEQATTAEVVAHYQSLANVEHRFRVMKDFLGLRPVFHYTDRRVRGHIAICVLAAVIEAVMANLLDTAAITDPDIETQTITPRRALTELTRIRTHHLTAGGNNITVTTRPNPLQAEILAGLDVNTHGWNKPTITSHPT